MREFPPEVHAGTMAAREKWRKVAEAMFPHALSLEIDVYGLRARFLNRSGRQFTIVWRYAGIPATEPERKALVEWLLDAGERLGPCQTIKYTHGTLHTNKV